MQTKTSKRTSRRDPAAYVLLTTRFYQQILTEWGTVSFDLTHRKKPKRGPPPMTSYEQYLCGVFQYSTSLASAVERAGQALWLLGTFPALRRLRAHSIGRFEWLGYHYFVYCVTLASVYDCALLLTNATFKLGLAPQACRDDTVAKNRHLLGSQVPQALKALKGKLKQLKPIRDRLVHRAAAPSFGDELELYLTAEWVEHKRAELGLDPVPDPVLPRPIRNDLMRREIRGLVARLHGELQSVSRCVATLLEALKPRCEQEVAAQKVLES